MIVDNQKDMIQMKGKSTQKLKNTFLFFGGKEFTFYSDQKD